MEVKPLVNRKKDKKIQAETNMTIELNTLFFICISPKFKIFYDDIVS